MSTPEFVSRESLYLTPPDPPTAAVLDEAARQAAPLSDRGEKGLRAWAEVFATAHRAVPGGLSIEVGTRTGGSALLFLNLLRQMYVFPNWPPLFVSVDPYGFKLYDDGIPGSTPLPAYGYGTYCRMKEQLRGYGNHAHFLLSSEDFLTRLPGAIYWHPGPVATPVKDLESGRDVYVPLGVPRPFGGGETAFALLDGAHDAKSVLMEVRALKRSWMAPGGRIVIDNVLDDPATLEALEAEGHDFLLNDEWAVVGYAPR